MFIHTHEQILLLHVTFFTSDSTCGEDFPLNANKMYSDTDEGVVMVTHCLPGYFLPDGTVSRSYLCQNDGSWSSVLTPCVGMYIVNRNFCTITDTCVLFSYMLTLIGTCTPFSLSDAKFTFMAR